MERFATSALREVGGRGGGYGEIEILVTEVEWAWYTRNVWKVGNWTTCWGPAR